MSDNQKKFKRRAWSTLLLITGILWLGSIGAVSASAATVNSPKPNTLFVSANVPSGFNNALCIVISDTNGDKNQTIRLDCTSSLSVNAQLPNGSYTILGAYTERYPNRYDVTCDTMNFTIGDGSSPTLVLTVQSHTASSEPVSSSSSAPPEETNSEGTAEQADTNASTEQTEEASPNSSEEQGSEPDVETEDSTSSKTEAEGENTEVEKPTNILKTIFWTILGIFGSVLLFSLVAVTTYIWRNRR